MKTNTPISGDLGALERTVPPTASISEAFKMRASPNSCRSRFHHKHTCPVDCMLTVIYWFVYYQNTLAIPTTTRPQGQAQGIVGYQGIVEQAHPTLKHKYS